MGKLDEIINAKKALGEAGESIETDDKSGNSKYSSWEHVRNSTSRLEIFNAKGASLAIDYSMIPVIFSPEAERIVIPTMLNIKITIHGINLQDIRRRLNENRVSWLRPHVGSVIPPDDGKEFVEKIEFEKIPFDDAVDKLADDLN